MAIGINDLATVLIIRLPRCLLILSFPAYFFAYLRPFPPFSFLLLLILPLVEFDDPSFVSARPTTSLRPRHCDHSLVLIFPFEPSSVASSFRIRSSPAPFIFIFWLKGFDYSSLRLRRLAFSYESILFFFSTFICRSTRTTNPLADDCDRKCSRGKTSHFGGGDFRFGVFSAFLRVIFYTNARA